MRSAYRYIWILAGLSVMAMAGTLLNFRTNNTHSLSSPIAQPKPPTSLEMPMMATALTMGDVMFTGYQSDDPDEFSFVLLTDIMAGTTLTFTDNGWLSAGGFRAGEGTLTVTFVNDFTCGTSLVVSNQGGSWTVSSSSGAIATVVSAGSFQLSTSGDQIFAYQGTAPTGVDQSHFVAAIQMNGTWDSNATNENTSAQPSVFSMSGLGLAISPERDNAQYDCSTISGSPTDLRAAIITTPNWDSDNSNVFDLGDFCDFCCGSGPPVTAPSQVEVNQMFNLDIGITPPTGVWELYGSAGCGVGAPLQTTTGTSFTVTAPASAGIATYYIKESTEDCCTPIDICVVNPDPSVICTDCNSDPLVCGDCFLPAPTDNPDLTATCDDLQMVFILDESGSIGNSGATNDVRDGVLAFMNALNGSGVEMAIIEFNATSRLVTNYQLINNALIASVTGYFNGVPFNGQTYSPSGNTNWHDAINDADNLAIQPDLLIFFTDGEPTAYGTTSSTNCSGNASVVNPVKIANKMKNEGTHMFMLGVGTGINSTNLQAMSGPTQYMNGVNSIGTSDWTIENFSTLAQCLEDFAYELCATSLSLQKTVINSSCDVVTFQFVVRNLGVSNVATSVVVKDTFPAGFASVMHSGPETVCIGNACAPMQPANTFCWTVGDLPPLTSDTLQITVTALTSGSKINTAWATSSTADTVSSTYDASGITTDNTNPVITCPANITVQCTQSTLPAVTGTATATDDQDPTPTITYSDVTAGTAPCITITRTWVATDDCDNSASCVQTITVEDNTPPTINCPANLTLNCGADTSAAATGMATASDNCMPSPTVTRSNQVTPGPCANTFSIQRTWRAVDACGNTNTCVQSIIVQDTTRPTIVCPANVTLYCPADTSAGANGMATGMDNCNNPVSVSHSNQIIPGSCPANYTINRTWRTLDACGNSNSCVQVIQVLDTTRPTINCPANTTVYCPGDTSVAATGTATGTDVCSEPVMISHSNQIVPGSCPSNYTINRTWRSVDGCGNSNTCVQVIQVLDTTRPVISCPPNLTLDCPADTSAAMTGMPTYSDVCSTVSLSHSNMVTPGSCGNTFTTNRQWRVVDACNNSNSCVQIIVVQDTTPPQLPTPPNDTTVSCPIDVPLPIPLVATDECSGPIFVFPPVDRFASSCDYIITRTWTFTDNCGNVDSVQQHIRVVDSIKPYFIDVIPNDTIYYSCQDTLPTVLPDGMDNCGSVAAEYVDVDLPSPCPGNPSVRAIQRTYTIRDFCGNDSIYVNWLFFVDTTPPVITPARDSIVTCDGAGNTAAYNDWIAQHGRATATDDCGPVTWSFMVIYSNDLCGATREDSVIFIATDLCGLADTTGAKFIIIDETPPTITPASPITIDCASGPEALNNWINTHGGATATDACSAVTWSNNFGGSPNACDNNNSIPVTFYATDDCGNVDSTTADLTIQDDTPPVINPEARDTMVQCEGGATDAYMDWLNNHGGAMATDDCGAVGWSYVELSNNPGCGLTRIYDVRFYATDACGNRDSTDATFSYIDTVPPVLPTPPNDTLVGCPQDAPLPSQLIAMDGCSGTSIPVVSTRLPFTPSCDFFITEQWIFVDPCGNRDTLERLIHVKDSLPPVFPGLIRDDSLFFDCTDTLPTVLPQASDACGSVSSSYEDVDLPSSCPSERIIQRTYTTNDFCGNSDVIVNYLVFRDRTAPVLTSARDTVVDCDGAGNTAAFAQWIALHGRATATDDCGMITWDTMTISRTLLCAVTRIDSMLFIVMDDCGNADTTQANFIIRDITPPVITPANDTAIDCSVPGGISGWLAINGGATATEECSSVTWSNNYGSAPGACGAQPVLVTFYAMDACGNIDSTTAMLSIQDTIPPTITSPARDTMVQCEGGATNAYMMWVNNHGGAAAMDDCGAISWDTMALSSTMPCGQTNSYVVRFYAVDVCGNRDSTDATFTYIDTVAPVPPSPPADVTVACVTDVPTPVSLNANDACEGTIAGVVSQILDDSTCVNGKTIRYQWVFTDGCLNSSTVTQTIVVKDSIAPVIAGVVDGAMYTVNCDDPVPTFTVTASDNCGYYSLIMSDNMMGGACASESMIERTWIARDTCGNADTVTITIAIVDTISPVVQVPADTMIYCTADTSVANLGDAIATDNCGMPALGHINQIIPGSCPQEYTIRRIWTAVDACLHVTMDTQLIQIIDTVAPILVTPPIDTTIECDEMTMSLLQSFLDRHGNAMATDECGAAVTWTYRYMVVPNACDPSGSNTFPVTFIYMDECGNQDSAMSMITIVDTRPPTITVEAADTTVNCDGAMNMSDFDTWVANMGGAEATDDCGVVNWRYEILGTLDQCAATRIDTVRFIVSDLCSNEDTTMALFIVIDTTPPMIIIRDTMILCDQDTSVSNLGGPTVIEDCGSSTLSHTDMVTPGTCPQEATITRTWVAVDECNNSSTVVQTIDVIDTIPPDVVCPAPSFASCTADEIPIITSWAQFLDSLGSATDNCNLDTTTFGYVGFRTVIQPTRRLVYREYQIGDGCGNFGSCEHLIIVQDVTPPDARCVDTLRVMADVNGVAIISVDAIDNGSTDNCGIDSMWLDRSGFSCSFYYNIDLVRVTTLYVRDFAGNISTCQATLIITCPCPPSPLPPTCNDEITVSLGSNCSFEVDASVIMQNYVEGCDDPYKVTLTNSSNVNIGNVVTENEMGQDLIFNIIDTTNGNRCWGHVHVEDKRPPQIICEDQTVSCIDPIPALPQVEENCSFQPKLDLLEESWTDYNCSDNTELAGVMHRKVRATDPWGNFRECEQDIYVRRESLDDLYCPADTVLECCTKDAEGVYKLWDTTYVWIDDQGYPHPKPLVFDGKVAGLVDVPYLVVRGDTTYVWDIQHGCNIIVDYQDDVIGLCEPSYMIRRNWIIKDWCRGTERHCTQLIKIVDNTPPVVKGPEVIKVAVDAHDCKATVVLKRPELLEECGFKFYKNDPAKAEALIKVAYELTYLGAKGKVVSMQGNIGVGKEEHIYLPEGDYEIHYYITDGCWNTREVTQSAWVVDDVAPVPVCDEITQVTLDPDSCWARVYAKDLDDGSYDGCCDQLHFAVASMNEIDYWRNYWREQLNACNPELYHYDTLAREKLIDHWIDCYVFNDYADITGCQEEQLVLRVYEACDLPYYDSHVFKGTEHDWYCWNLYNDFACYFRLNYDSVNHYQRPRPNLCDENYATTCINAMTESPNMPYRNQLCCSYPTQELQQKWVLMQSLYPELVELSASRWWFPHLSSDCMIQLRKDDKQAPIVEAPADVTVYCDGVPYWVEVPFKAGESGNYVLHGPRFAWNVCSPEGDYLSTGSCPESGWYNDEIGGRCCLEIPWDGGVYGYYQGPKYDYYNGEGCGYVIWAPEGEELKGHATWKPTYCMLWLWLDKFDQQGGGKPKVSGDEPVITDNCTPFEDLLIDYSESGGLNECGVGTLTRTWKVQDGCGNSSEGHQTIHVLPRSDFEVIFPADVTVTCEQPGSLAADRTGAGAPLITDDDCELIGINYEDEIYHGEGGCYQIQRTWKIIDWCVFNADVTKHHAQYPDVIVDDRVYAGSDRSCIYRYLKDNGDGYMVYTQWINVVDEVAPQISCTPDTVLCTYDALCAADTVRLTLGIATDNCTDSASIDYRYSVRALDEPVALIYGTGRELLEVLGYGEYEVTLIAEDLCGNADTCYTQLQIRDCKSPTPYCHDGIVTVLMNVGGSVTVWAKDLDAGSYDNCTAKDSLQFSFTEDGETPSRTYTCNDLPNGKRNVFNVDIWVIDQDGNRDYCTVSLEIQDNSDACSDISTPLQVVEGTIATEQGAGVEHVEVQVPQMNPAVTNAQGKYVLEGLEEQNEYKLNPYRNDQMLNGVSTLDLLKIQKHILGIESLETPYQLIAADINNSESLSVVDLLDLRKVILGILDTFPNNRSWRFVDRSYVFADPTSPWGYPENKQVSPSKDSGNADFIGVKVGDVNGSSQPNGLAGIEVREEGKFWLSVDDRQVVAGETVDIPVYAETKGSVEGWQWTFEAMHAQIIEIYGDAIGLTKDNIGYQHSKEGVVTMSWNSLEPVNLPTGTPMFSIRLKMDQEGWLSDVLRVHSRYTPAEAYLGNDEVVGVSMKYHRGGDVLTQAVPKLYQNTPNPFIEYTIIGFEIPEASDLVLTILDMSGKIVKQVRGYYGRGYHEIEVKANELSRSGVLHYQLQTKDYVQVRKMIMIK